MLTRRRIALGVSGGVAAYKAVYLARRLVESGAEVRVVMTESATRFVGPQSFAAVTGKPPVLSLFGDDSVSPHTELARWADLIVVAPATAATISRLAHGLSDDALSATLLATRAQVLLAPAMHTEMWEHPATEENVATIRRHGHHIIGPDLGDLAGGDTGMGRMAEPEAILDIIEELLEAAGVGVTMLVTAGGTREAIDPVRYIGNRSSGKMGHAIADVAARHGYEVTLVTTSSIPTLPQVKVVLVESAEEMLTAVEGVEAEVAVLCAAVADFQPVSPRDTKMARVDDPESIALKPTPDILATVVARQPKPFTIGFAAETGGVQRAVEKAKAKTVDLLVYNDVSEPGSGFGSDTNRVAIIDRQGFVEEWPQMSKSEVAEKLIARIESELKPSR